MSDQNLIRLLEEAHRLTAKEFTAAHPELFFLVEQMAEDSPPLFNTDVPTKRGQNLPTGNIEVCIIGVKKSSRSPYQNRISIGRARSCDIVIRDQSISKLHAYVAVNPGGTYSIVDVGSHNGTRIGARVLSPHVAEPLNVGDNLMLGSVAVTTLDAASAHNALLKLYHANTAER